MTEREKRLDELRRKLEDAIRDGKSEDKCDDIRAEIFVADTET